MDSEKPIDVGRLRRLEDIEAVRRLQAVYCRLSDRGFPNAGSDSDALAQLFTVDGVWEVEGGEVCGREAIAARLGAFGPFGFHLAVNGDIEIRGEMASARWHALVPATSLDAAAVWTAGIYDTALVRTNDGWRFARVAFLPAFRAPYEEGWNASLVGSYQSQRRDV